MTAVLVHILAVDSGLVSDPEPLAPDRNEPTPMLIVGAFNAVPMRKGQNWAGSRIELPGDKRIYYVQESFEDLLNLSDARQIHRE